MVSVGRQWCRATLPGKREGKWRAAGAPQRKKMKKMRAAGARKLKIARAEGARPGKQCNQVLFCKKNKFSDLFVFCLYYILFVFPLGILQEF